MTAASDHFADAVSAPLFSAELWPHRSLSPRGFFLVAIGATTALAIPLFSILGSAAFWVVLGFCLLDLALLLGLILLTYRSGRLRETVSVWPNRLRVERFEPNGARKSWEANPHWVRLRLISTPKVEDYLVLSSGGREIELGAFLTPSERRSLAQELRQALNGAARTPSTLR